MRQVAGVVTVVGLVLLLGAPLSAELSRAQIEEGIERGAKIIVAGQADDGRWPYISAGVEDPQYQVGHTALMVLALQHSGSKLPEVSLAIKKGMSYILQQPPEPRTYSTGLVMQCLYMDRGKEHTKPVTAYAWMLISGQKTLGCNSGSWDYPLPMIRPDWLANGPGPFGNSSGKRVDNSNGQFGILGVVYAGKCGFQVPRIVWERAKEYYIRAQHADGGWDYQSDIYRAEEHVTPNRESTMAMTLAGTVSLYLCDEMLADKNHRQCETPPPNPAYENGLKFIAQKWPQGLSTEYAFYACERLGLLTGYSEFGGHDWYQEGARAVINAPGHGYPVNDAFAVLFLSRGRNPIIINKLKRQGDWNLHRYDIGHLVEHISGPWQTPCQWRIVTLEPPVEFLLKVPILWISGHETLKFTPEEKAKLKEYVEKGGTILGEDCCSKKAFDTSFRALLKELWPENDLTDLPKTHAIFTHFRKLTSKPNLMAMALNHGQGRVGVIYMPNGISCRWEVGGAGGRPWLDVGACIYLYVEKFGKRMQGEGAGAQTGAGTPEAVKTETPPADEVKPPAENFGGAEQ